MDSDGVTAAPGHINQRTKRDPHDTIICGRNVIRAESTKYKIFKRVRCPATVNIPRGHHAPPKF